ncbi:universal stress protein [Variovorax sp. MHTC-1]|uniref:universal stress protein n=1 Tax=Variovorax sp. MHTC-1 TaxID=2495593 RepID=UPI000F878D41|nr:universal stress protein [Variovorax sp. MHTC-1]RST48648.1 universal stress protein [Variovorax sp. MHTC-1]
MNKVIACVDGAAYTVSVSDHAAWAARRLEIPLEFLHVLDRHPERAPASDLSGSIGLGTRESLLEELSALDERRSVLAQQHGRELLAGLVQRSKEAGLAQVESRQRHGSLVEAIEDLEPVTRLFVLGQHRRGDSAGILHLDHNVERVIRAAKRPVLVASEEYKAPGRFAIAFDGSATGQRIVDAVAGSPLLRGLHCTIVTVGDETASTRAQLSRARDQLAAAGLEVATLVLAGEPETALPEYLATIPVDLLVMGAYGHSRIRHLIVGSTTTTLLRTSPVPVLVIR